VKGETPVVVVWPLIETVMWWCDSPMKGIDVVVRLTRGEWGRVARSEGAASSTHCTRVVLRPEPLALQTVNNKEGERVSDDMRVYER
jgi:hypothetical protein